MQFADRLNHSFSESFVKLCLCTHFDSFVVRSETTTKTMKEWKIVYLDCVCSLGERMFIGKRDIAVLNKKKVEHAKKLIILFPDGYRSPKVYLVSLSIDHRNVMINLAFFQDKMEAKPACTLMQ